VAEPDLHPDKLAQIKNAGELGQAFIELCNDYGKSRELALAITNMEMAVMWFTKAIVKS
jgi:hypothetical protein